MIGPQQILKRAQRVVFPVTCGIAPIQFHEIIHPAKKLTTQFSDWDKDLGAGTFWEVCAIAILANYFQPKLCLEIGTGLGRTTLHLALNTNDQAQVLTFDITDHPNVGMIFRNNPAQSKIKKVTANSKEFDFSPYFGKIDFVMIDGGHDYQTVAFDTQTAFKLVAPNGLIIWDDFSPDWPGVVKALNECSFSSKLRRIAGTSYVYYKNSMS